MRRKNVTLVDVQDSELLRRLENEYRIKPRDGEGKKILKKRIAVLKQFLRFRYGAVSSYASEVGQGGLLSYRKGISSSRIRLLPGRAWETGIKLHSLDLVVDRGTLGWIYGQGEGRLKRTVAHYIDILREGGKAVLFFNEAEQPNEENVKIRDALKKAGRKNNISVQEISIDSKTVTPARKMGSRLSGKSCLVACAECSAALPANNSVTAMRRKKKYRQYSALEDLEAAKQLPRTML